MDGVQIEKQELRVTRTTSIDSDNRSDRSEEEDLRRARKRAASTSPSPIPMDKRTARFECPKCRQRFDSVNAFDIHRFTAHSDETKTGFDDLTFVDFSSKKFPEIARGVCERNPHVSVTEQRYRCDMCCRDFPCGQALEMHRKSCASATRIPTPERDRTREDFFAKLDLKNRSFGIPGTLTPPMERFTPKFDDGHLTNGIRHIDAARDLADIQSILNPNNDEVNSKLARDEVKRSLAFHTPDIDRRNESTGRDTPLTHFTPSFITDRHPVTNLTTKPLPLPLPESPLPLPIPRDSEQPTPRIKVKGIGQLTQIPPEFRPPEISYKQNDISHDSYDEEAPVDLSTSDNNSCDVLDLSKKKRDADAEEPKSTPRPSFEPDPASVAATAFEKTRLLLASQRLFENSLPKIDPAYYASQLSQLYAGAVPGIPGLPLPPSFPIAPYLLQPSFFHHPTDSRELAEIKDHIQKEIIRGLSMSGGRLVPNDPESQPKLEPEEDEQKPPPSVSPVPSPHSESPRPQMNNTLVPQTDSVKMVIKNGVLMPKQKQRRYRTERPFSCSQCSARFTLRSNMERHVKQQHPQHWSVRRPAPRAPPPYPTPDSLTDRMKFALLARHLERPLQQSEHSPVRRDSDEVADNEEDEEDTLVIDEEPEMENKAEDHTAARRAAAEILMATCQQEMTKDFDLKIAGNLINKPVPITNDKTESGTNSVSPTQEPLPVPVVPTRSDEEEDEEGLVASTSEGNNSGSDENKYRYQDDDGSGSEIPSNVNNNNSPPSAPYEKKLKLDMTSRKYSSEAENDPENSDLIGKLLGIPDKTINKLLSSADEAAKILGVNK
ncbi:hypothetical protein B5X24_HaOG204498 [Helicoverpa armigera]|uniref:C2H2-type domain-containing protein n=1 Tax=Helicoverpa armigera TaxID=29058 RepID=A0A2W1BXP3_HELAM|nr:hypothetical protein B5X24_HaOG204498 [Helicoverpa armigera]